jgi:hypothetical protein
MPKTKVLIYGNVVVAYGRSRGHGAGRSVHLHGCSDATWIAGAWHVIFAQQTAAAAS